MLKQIEQFFKTHIGATPSSQGSEHALHLATAALLLEVMAVDEDDHPEERRTITQALTDKFQLSQDEINQLIKLADQETKQASDYHQFTALINQHFSPRQKNQLMEQLWQVAYADNKLDKYEEHLIRKLSDLLYIPHKVFIASKHRAQIKSS